MSFFAINERRDMGLYEVPLSVSLFWDRDCVSQLPCVRYYVFVKSRFKYTHEECESKRANVSVMLYPCMFCVALSMDLFVFCVA